METEPRASSLLPRPPPAPIRASRAPPAGRASWCTEVHARLHCRTGWGAAGVRKRQARAAATPQGPARAKGGPAAASALSAPNPSPSCPPTPPFPAPSFPAHAAPPERKEGRAPSRAGQGGEWRTLTVPTTLGWSNVRHRPDPAHSFSAARPICHLRAGGKARW
ncbi:hypothetical protein P7K49_018458 [Saguinus oedipus]|uniref:Uncharacterized protein n=1 Tax=Saguinus oedipus TaxID=9490 RepID=A0ABQ9V878_SAGOE|nr:hypothetical protein P7K49_018458 [Saguinus oedipus]